MPEKTPVPSPTPDDVRKFRGMFAEILEVNRIWAWVCLGLTVSAAVVGLGLIVATAISG